MINELTIQHNPTEPEDLQSLHGFISYHMDMEPRKVTVKLLAESTTKISKSPSKSAWAPTGVPVTIILAPAKGIPVSSLTFPLIDFWAKALWKAVSIIKPKVKRKTFRVSLNKFLIISNSLLFKVSEKIKFTILTPKINEIWNIHIIKLIAY